MQVYSFKFLPPFSPNEEVEEAIKKDLSEVKMK